MTLVPQLQEELTAAARRSAARRPRAARRTSVLVAAALLLLALTAVALAATGVIGSGEPLKPSPDTPHNPRSGLGIPKPGAAQLLPLRVADPDGGPPWGARYIRTTRGVGCLQLGRARSPLSMGSATRRAASSSPAARSAAAPHGVRAGNRG
jgi:type II secretory pathway pseudopilin PulG